MEMPPLSDHESTHYARSTLADALTPPKNLATMAYTSGESDCESSIRAPRDPVKETSVSITSREVIRRYFAETNPISLPQGHPTVAFNQDQMCHMLNVVADQTAKSIFEMMNSVIQKASQLNFGQTGTRPGEMHRPKSVQSAESESGTDPYTLRHRTPSRQSDFGTQIFLVTKHQVGLQESKFLAHLCPDAVKMTLG